MQTPILGITMGDASGIGPEIIVSAWPEIVRQIPCRPFVYGHPDVLRRTGSIIVREINSPAEAPLPCPNSIPCLRCGPDSVTQVLPGGIDARAGDAAYQAIVRAIDDAKAGTIDGVVTAPIHKGALNLAGHHYPGHTEIFAERCGVDDFAMMLYLGAGENIASPNGLAVVHVTLHTAMKNIFDQITVESVLAKTRLADHFMRRIFDRSDRTPSIGVCSLNPHAGEDGLFGREEIEIIRPAVEAAVAEKRHVEGPFPADTIMIDAKNGKYDAVVAMFHDQGHIALKLLGMHRAVNVTLGLPIIRTSVAHGTAFDKAWQCNIQSGGAQFGSMIEAVRVAAKLAVTDRGRSNS